MQFQPLPSLKFIDAPVKILTESLYQSRFKNNLRKLAESVDIYLEGCIILAPIEEEEMTKHVHVSSAKEAWEEALRLLPEGVSRDERVTWARIYHGAGNRYVSDLGDRLEVNHGEYGELTTMVWIDRKILPLRESIRAIQERRDRGVS